MKALMGAWLLRHVGLSEVPADSALQRAVFFVAIGFDTGAGTGCFFQKLLSADALTHPGFSERVLFPLVFADGAIIVISDVYEKFALELLCPVEHNPEVHTAAYLDFDTVLYLDFQEARPAMSLCFSFSWSFSLPLVNAIPWLCLLWSINGKHYQLSGGNSVLRLMRLDRYRTFR